MANYNERFYMQKKNEKLLLFLFYWFKTNIKEKKTNSTLLSSFLNHVFFLYVYLRLII